MAPYLSSIMSVLVLHRAMGASAVDLLAVTGDMNPKFGVPLLLAILFYNNIICAKDLSSDFHQMLVRYSHNLILQVIVVEKLFCSFHLGSFFNIILFIYGGS